MAQKQPSFAALAQADGVKMWAGFVAFLILAPVSGGLDGELAFVEVGEVVFDEDGVGGPQVLVEPGLGIEEAFEFDDLGAGITVFGLVAEG